MSENYRDDWLDEEAERAKAEDAAEEKRFMEGCVCGTFLWLLAGKNCPVHKDTPAKVLVF